LGKKKHKNPYKNRVTQSAAQTHHKKKINYEEAYSCILHKEKVTATAKTDIK